MPSPHLQGRHVLVTGAGGTLGRALTQALHEAGALVTAFVRNRSAGPEVAASAAPDLGDPRAVGEAVEELGDVAGPIHALIHAAATGSDRLMARQSLESWNELCDAQVRAAFVCTQAVLPGFFQHGGGVILHIGSLAATRPEPGQCAYAAYKGALESLTRAQARELAPKHIRVNCLAPGFIDSPRVAALPAAQQDKLRSRLPLARWARPAEVAAWAVFLVSPQAAYLTGQTLHLDGGASI